MEKDPNTADPFDLNATIFLGIIIGFSGILSFGGIYLIVSLFDFQLPKFIHGIGVIALYCSFLSALLPLLGTLFALGRKSWDVFKTWLLASFIGVIINVIIATILLNIT